MKAEKYVCVYYETDGSQSPITEEEFLKHWESYGYSCPCEHLREDYKNMMEKSKKDFQKLIKGNEKSIMKTLNNALAEIFENDEPFDMPDYYMEEIL